MTISTDTPLATPSTRGRLVATRLVGLAVPITAVVAALAVGAIVLRCTPYATFATPPRHLHSNDQDEKVTHWLSGSVPWAAIDLKVG